MDNSFKVIVAGGRDFDDYKTLCEVCDYMLSKQNHVEIVSGAARGADKLGETYSKERDYWLTQFLAAWDTHGKAAGYIRNKQMAEYADALIAFWDGRSKGTKHMIDLAKEYNLKIKIVHYDK